MAKEPMKSRNVRVGDALWKAAMETADQDGTDVASVIRDFLAWYTRDPRAPQPYRPPARRAS